MKVTAQTLAAIAGRPPNANMASIIAGLQRGGIGAGLERPHRLAHYLAQLAHESGGFRYDAEIWGNTPAQKRYEGRRDLGNVKPGDGFRYRGRGPIQITGRANYREFTGWARRMAPDAPDFEANPDAVNTDPWEGLVPIWYWSSRGLNQHADANDASAITKRINGGFNGLDDRLSRYTRAALVLLGYAPTDVAGFQRAAGIGVDGKAGPVTRAALHRHLQTAGLASFGAALASEPPPPPKPAVLPRPVDPRPSPPPSDFASALGWGAIGVGIVLLAAAFFGS